MNERIRDLAEQAGWDRFWALDERNEKFAELIVQECANMVEEHQPRYLTRGQAQEIADTIREHFGVEE